MLFPRSVALFGLPVRSNSGLSSEVRLFVGWIAKSEPGFLFLDWCQFLSGKEAQAAGRESAYLIDSALVYVAKLGDATAKRWDRGW